VGSAEALGGPEQNHLQYAVEIIDGIAVPEPDDRPALFFQKGRSSTVINLRIDMLGTIKLDRQFCRSTGNIDDIGSNDKLAREPWPITG